MRGLEIGPYFNPIAPKSEGYDTITVDVHDAITLRRLAAADPNIESASIDSIEEVDIVGSAAALSELLATRGITDLDFVVSSHNFEHLPDAIGFLNAVERALKPGGVLTMAIPDKRRCFDHFRPLSTLVDFLEAYHSRSAMPTPAQVLAHAIDCCRFEDSLPLTVLLRKSYDSYLARREHGGDYVNVHCWTFTPTSFRLLIEDLRHLGLMGLEILDLESLGGEFVVWLAPSASDRSSEAASEDDTQYRKRRTALRHEIARELVDSEGVPSPLGRGRTLPTGTAAPRTVRNLWRFLRRRPLG
ncbi:MAG: methyltransferase domain-containing protein [Azospirillaceae bacterium]